MRSPLRLLRSWIDDHRLSERRRVLERHLSHVLRQSVILLPTISGGGIDRICRVQTGFRDSQTIACVRMNCPWRESSAGSCLPRISLSAAQRIAREARAYSVLAPHGLAPKLILQGDDFLANQWLAWPRVADVLKRSGSALWTVLPAVLSGIQRMHRLGVVHMDLNCGNLLIHPDFLQVAVIDFEYAPAPHLSWFDQQRFDYLRLAHNLLKPRRGREPAHREPHRFIQCFAEVAPESGCEIPGSLPGDGFLRVLEHSAIRSGFENLFGTFETPTLTARAA